MRLAAKERFVIRYDKRDVGRSICCPPGEIHYSIHDLVDDAVEVLDSFGIEKEPGDGPVWLEVTLPEGTEDFLSTPLDTTPGTSNGR
jgi:hypothetical protein